MPIPMERPIYCSKCKKIIKMMRFGDALSLQDLHMIHHSVCKSCKMPYWCRLWKRNENR